jgi:isopenicillin N synthase-like dioxygenase
VSIPVIDLSSPSPIGEACRRHGFFYLTGHGVSEDLQERLEAQSREFFAQDVATKLEIRMELAGAAWRGYFPVGDELTSGEPDRKEVSTSASNRLPAGHCTARTCSRGCPVSGRPCWSTWPR